DFLANFGPRRPVRPREVIGLSLTVIVLSGESTKFASFVSIIDRVCPNWDGLLAALQSCPGAYPCRSRPRVDVAVRPTAVTAVPHIVYSEDNMRGLLRRVAPVGIAAVAVAATTAIPLSAASASSASDPTPSSSAIARA